VDGVKSRIIQHEPELEPVASQEIVAAHPPDGEGETWLRRSFLFVAVVGYIVLGAVHPANIEVGDETTLYLALHVVQPVLILLLAWGIWLLVKDLPGRAAQVARVAIVPYAIAYSMLDAIAGVALGQAVREANGMSASDAAVVQRVLDGNGGQDYIGIAIFVASGLAWFVMALAAALAVKQIGGLGPSLLMTIGAAIFAVGHPFPTGPIGIALFGLGVAWLEVRRARAPIPEPQPALAS
jgi:uncharacterized membrane protein YccF (DUF307 family)